MPTAVRPDARLDSRLLRPSAALLGAQIALGAAIDRAAVAESDLDATMLDLLIRLELSPDHQLRAVELCGQLLLSPSHISRMLDRAERARLVERRPDPDDRRAKIITITDEGRAAVAQFAPRLHAVLKRVIFEALELDEIEALIGYLERIEASARTCPTRLRAK